MQPAHLQVTKVWWDGDKLMAKPIPALEVYADQPAAQPASADEEIASHAKRLALELECLLLSCDDTAAVSKRWQPAQDALEAYRAAIDRLYPPEHPTFMGEPVVSKGGAA